MSGAQIPVHLEERSYTIHVDHSLLPQVGTILSSLELGKTCVILSHPSLFDRYGDVLENAVKAAGFNVHVLLVPEGEETKSFTQVSRLLDQLFPLRLERKDTLIAFGGGVIGDLGGFVASLYMRGIHVVQVPTTLLAQVDAAIGGKTAVNHAFGKNLIGSFHQPRAVLSDISVLQSLPEREFRSGLAEVVKYGMIWSEDFFSFLEQNVADLHVGTISTHPKLWAHIIQTSAEIKAKVVSEDEHESDLRAILNYGHTIAHGIESVFAYNTYFHGEAVAIGMVGASLLSMRFGLSTSHDHDRLVHLLKALGFSCSIQSGTTSDAIFDKLLSDKKIKNGALRFVLNKGIGKTTLFPVQDHPLICSVIQTLMEDAQ